MEIFPEKPHPYDGIKSQVVLIYEFSFPIGVAEGAKKSGRDSKECELLWGGFIATGETEEDLKTAKRNVAAQHETINGRLVQWRSLYHMFRHSHHEHKYFFFTAVIIDNLNYQKYGPTFAKSY